MAAMYDDDYYDEEENEHPFANGADADFLVNPQPLFPNQNAQTLIPKP